MIMENERSTRQEDGEFEARLVNVARPCLKNKTTAANPISRYSKTQFKGKIKYIDSFNWKV